MSLNEYIYLLSQESGSAPALPPVDYIIVAGQSNIDGRTDKSAFDAKYSGPMTNVLVWNGSGLQQWKPDIAGVTLSNKVNQLAWDTLVLKDLADQIGVTLRVIKHAWGGSAVGATGDTYNYKLENGSWNIGVPGANWEYLRDKIRSVVRYEREVNQKQARFRLLLWDQGEGDGSNLEWSQNYVTYTNNTLGGNFVDLVSAMRTEALNTTLPVVFAQKMTTQADAYRANVIAAQALLDAHDPNAYMLAMNANTARYPLADAWHYNATAVTNVAQDMKSIITSNNLLSNWQQ